MSKNTVLFIFLCVAMVTLNVVLTAAGNGPTTAKPKPNNPPEYGVSTVTCYAKRKGASGTGKRNDDMTQTCCKEPYGDCRQWNYIEGNHKIYCLVNSKENEKAMKDCCNSKETSTKFGTTVYTGVSEKAEKNGTGYKEFKSCDCWFFC